MLCSNQPQSHCYVGLSLSSGCKSNSPQSISSTHELHKLKLLLGDSCILMLFSDLPTVLQWKKGLQNHSIHFCNCKWLLLVTVMYQLHPLVWNVHLFSWLLGFINDAKICITWQIRMPRIQAINSERFQRKSVTKWHERLTVLQLWFCPSQKAVMHFLALCDRQTFKCMV